MFLALSWLGGLVIAAGFFMLTRGIVYLFRRRWGLGLGHLFAFPALVCVGLVGAPMLAFTLVELGILPAPFEVSELEPPYGKARLLAESISEVINSTVYLGLFGLALGFILRPSRRRSESESGEAS
jgi:hypothetical protein